MKEGLQAVIGEVTRIKIAIDKGPVYAISIPGHEALDVLGTTIDRCARIAKFTKPGVVLTSYNYRKDCNPGIRWVQVGEPGSQGSWTKQGFFQFNKKTVDIIETAEIPVNELKALQQDLTRQAG